MKLAKIYFVLISLVAPAFLFAESNLYNLQVTTSKKIGEIPKNQSFIINDLVVKPYVVGYDMKYVIMAICDYENRQIDIPATDIRKNGIFKVETNMDLMLSSFIQSEAMESLIKNGSQFQMRKELEEESFEYLNYINSQNLALSDLYLENYIYSLIYKILPIPFVPLRTGQINLVIEKNTSLNAGIYPNGTLCITTGLLSALQSEDELVAVLSHEIGHFVLDHCVVNINKQIARKKKAEFWSAVATGAVAVAEGVGSVVAAKNGNYYLPGAATMSTAVISSAIAQSVTNRLGMEYNHEQEMEADQYALMALNILGYDCNGLAVALSRIKNLEIKEGNYSSYFSSSSHPALYDRIIKAGNIVPMYGSEYVKMVSFSNSANSLLDFERRYYFSAYQTTKINIDHKVASVDDLIINAACQQMLSNSEEANEASLLMLERALQLSPNNLNALKYKIIVYLRKRDSHQALSLLDEYGMLLSQELDKINRYHGQKTWESTFSYLNTEIVWYNNMRLKLSGGII